jgi:hypothetical protein
MSPLAIQFCIAFYAHKNPSDMLDASYDSSAGKEIKEWMVAEKLIADGTEAGVMWGQPTDRLKAFIDHLCAQQLPVAETITRWVQP